MTIPNIWGNSGNSNWQFDIQPLSYDTCYMDLGNNNLSLLLSSGNFLGNWEIKIPQSLNFMNFFNLYQKFGSNSGGNIGGFLNGMNYCSSINYSFGTGINPCFTLNSSSSSSSTNTAKDPATESEKKTHDALKSILNRYAEWYEDKYGDNDIKDEIAEIEKSDTTAEKTQKLRELYDNHKSDIADFLTKNLIDDKIPLNRGKGIKEALQDLGIEETDDGKQFANDLISKAEELGDTEINLADGLGGNTLVGLISSYNTTQKNFIDELCSKDFDNPGVKTLLKALIKQLVEEAKAQCNNLETENKFYETLEGMTINKSTDKYKFKEEFNKVYTYTRTLASRAADSMFTRYYGIETTMFSDKAKADLGRENSINKEDIKNAEKLELKPNAYIGKPPAVIAAKKVKEKEAEGKAKETLDEMANGQLLVKGKEKIKIGENEYETYTEAFGDDKKTYIAVDDEIHTVTKKDDGWTDTGKVDDWQENINKKLINAQIETDKKAEETKTKEENAGIQQSEFNLVKTKTGKDTEKYGKITINDKKYNVFKSGDGFYIVKKKVINEVYKLPSSKIEYDQNKKEIQLKASITEDEVVKYQNSMVEQTAKKAIDLLQGFTTDTEWSDFVNIVDNEINSENVLDFINAYSENKGRRHTGLFCQLLSENHVAWDTSKKLVSYLMEFISNHCREIDNYDKKAQMSNLYEILAEVNNKHPQDASGKIHSVVSELNKILKE